MGTTISAVIFAGIMAGTIDVGAAALINHVGVGIVLQAIAAGVLGKASFAGGMPTMALGLGLQSGMSVLISIIYWSAASRIDFMQANPLLCGCAYGVGVFAVMTYVVVPLSRAKANYPPTLTAAIPDLCAMVVFGLIIAFLPMLGKLYR